MMTFGNFTHMNMTMMIIKGRKVLWSLLLLPVLILLVFIRPGQKGSPDGRQPELQTFQLGDGWGYRIMMNKKVLIYQPTIPAIDTLMPFPDEASARTIGSLVLERLNKKQNFSITIDDLIHSLSDLETNDNST